MTEGRWRISVTAPDWGEDHLTLDAIVAFVDEELESGPQARATRHVARCGECAAQVVAQTQARVALRTAPGPRLPSSLLSSLRSIPEHADLPATPHGLAVTEDGQLVCSARPEQAERPSNRSSGRRSRFSLPTALISGPSTTLSPALPPDAPRSLTPGLLAPSGLLTPLNADLPAADLPAADLLTADRSDADRSDAAPLDADLFDVDLLGADPLAAAAVDPPTVPDVVPASARSRGGRTQTDSDEHGRRRPVQQRLRVGTGVAVSGLALGALAFGVTAAAPGAAPVAERGVFGGTVLGGPAVPGTVPAAGRTLTPSGLSEARLRFGAGLQLAHTDQLLDGLRGLGAGYRLPGPLRDLW